jgi:drug/metabolite transporter (DMT)-like permease
MANSNGSGELPPGAALFTVFLCMLFGANVVAIKISFLGVGVFTTAFLRFFIASVAIFFWARWRGVNLRIASRQQLHSLMLVGMIFFLQMSGMYLGQNLTTASHGALLANLLPFIVMILAHFFLEDDRIQPRKVIGLLFGFGGVVLLFFDARKAASGSLLGDLIILGAVVLWSCNVVMIKRIIANLHPLQVTIYPMLFSVPLLLLCAFVFDDRLIWELTPPIVIGILYQSLVTATFGFIMWNTMIKKYGATALHSFVFIVPIAGVTCGVLMLGDPLTPKLIGSICCVASGLVVVNYRRRKVVTPAVPTQ